MSSIETLPLWVQTELSAVGDQLPTSPNPDAHTGLLVPLYDERPEDPAFHRLLDSIGAQDVPQTSIEAVFLVNNDELPGHQSPERDRWQKVYRNNQRMLGYLASDEVRERTGEKIALTVIDCSSPGRVIADNNVGRARQRALAVVASRFFMNRNLRAPIQLTDADSHFANPNHFATLEEEYSRDPSLMGMAQRLKFEIHESDHRPDEWAEFEQHLDALFVLLACRRLLLFMQGTGSRHNTSGANTSCRLDAALGCGGFRPVGYKEDGLFGEALRAYAAENGGFVKNVKDMEGLEVRSTFRVSTRTGNSMAPNVAKLRAGEPVTMAHPITGEEIELNGKTYPHLQKEVEEFVNSRGESGAEFRAFAEEYGQVTVARSNHAQRCQMPASKCLR